MELPACNQCTNNGHNVDSCDCGVCGSAERENCFGSAHDRFCVDTCNSWGCDPTSQSSLELGNVMCRKADLDTCHSIQIDNVSITKQRVADPELGAAIRSQTVLNADNCGSTSGATVTIEEGQQTTISTYYENTYTDSWSRTWGISGEIGGRVQVKWKSGWALSAVGGAAGVAEVHVDVAAHRDATSSWDNSTTTGHNNEEVTYSSITYQWEQPGESKSDIIIIGNKYNFEIEWEGEATCLSADGTVLGAKTVTGVYKSAGYSDISYQKSDGVCNGDRYCQPDLAQISAQIHISTDEILQRNYLWSALQHACDPEQGGVDCTNLPHQCQDNQESMARWAYSKYFIQKCEGAFDIHNPCTCEFPIYPYGPDDRIASAGLTWADTNACTYGLPGSYGYDDIPNEDKVPRTYDSLAATFESDRIVTLLAVQHSGRRLRRMMQA